LQLSHAIRSIYRLPPLVVRDPLQLAASRLFYLAANRPIVPMKPARIEKSIRAFLFFDFCLFLFQAASIY
jgi:hypothetical protein